MRILFAVVFSLTTVGLVMATPVDDFWSSLSDLCDQAFEGQVVQEPEGESDFEGQRLVMHVRDCSDSRIRIPFVVGDDLSRTWVLTRHGERIELKHDHRNEDGTPEEVTMYGGTTTNANRADIQYFPADEQTREVIDYAFSNIWQMAIEPGERFDYGVRRLGTPRVFLVEFDLTRSVEPPPAPWGWE